jgi:putative tryptophan/tyrosine transport system substrate-binding protein
MKRREFIAAIAGVAAWPLASRAQQPSIPVVGWLGAYTPEAIPKPAEAFRRALSETGFVDGHSVKIEYRWPENGYAQLPALAADLVSRKVDAIFAIGQSAAALAAKTATATIPIVFLFGADPIKVGLVASLNRPGGNVTGITILANELNAKKLEIMHGLVPATAAIALLVNPDSPTVDSAVQDTQEAADALGRRLSVLRASNEREIDTAWAGIVEQSAGGLVVAGDGFFGARRDQLVALAARHRIPAIYETSGFFVRAGGFISYGADFVEAARLAGIYVGRILKGEKPADLPVLQPTKFDLVINLKTAKALGITIPDALLIQATELIE